MVTSEGVVGAVACPDPEPAKESLASRVDADRAKILNAFMRGLDGIGSVIASAPVGRELSRALADEILTDIMASLNSDSVQPSESRRLNRDLCAGLRPHDMLRATIVFQEAAHEAALSHLGLDEAARRPIALFFAALSRGVSRLVEETTDSYLAFLLDRAHEAHVAERHRVARELHDRVGGALSTAYRMLDLYDMLQQTDPPRAAARLASARSAIAEAMDSLRESMSGLRLADRVISIEGALLRFIESAQPDGVDVRLRINGDECWVSPAVRDETYLILREAIRNSLTHGHPSVVAITVTIALRELRATVADNGCGFERSRVGSRGDGLSSMRERASRMGGYVTVSSRPDHGTNVELVIPQPGRTTLI